MCGGTLLASKMERGYVKAKATNNRAMNIEEGLTTLIGKSVKMELPLIVPSD